MTVIPIFQMRSLRKRKSQTFACQLWVSQVGLEHSNVSQIQGGGRAVRKGAISNHWPRPLGFTGERPYSPQKFARLDLAASAGRY